MALRTVHDPANVEWRVWDVRPTWAPSAGPASGQEPGEAPGAVPRPVLAPHLADGWLAMQSSSGERRRVVPIPEGWSDLSDDALLRLVTDAAVQPEGRKRLIE